MLPSCASCNEVVPRENNQSVQCGECGNLYHPQCAGVSADDFNSYKALPKAQRNSWKCKDCKKKRTSFMRSGSVSDAELDTAREVRDMRAELSNFGRKFETFLDRFDTMMRRIDNVEGNSRALEERVIRVEESVNDLAVEADRKEVEIVSCASMRDEEKYEMAVKIIKASLEVPLLLGDIDRCYIIKRKKSNTGTGETGSSGVSLVVGFSTCRVRDLVMNE